MTHPFKFKMIFCFFMSLGMFIFGRPVFAENFGSLTPEHVQKFDLSNSNLVSLEAREAAWMALNKAEKLYWNGRLGDLPAIQELERRASAHEPAYMAYWGLMKALGAEGVEVDLKVRDQLFKDAFPFIKRAAEQGVPAAQNILGFMYEHASGIPDVLPTNSKVAFFWTQKAAEAGHPLAQNNLGKMYEKGIGTPSDPQAAVIWYRRAADQGHALAAVNVGRAYEKGAGVLPNDRTALWYYILAAQRGHLLSYHPIGEMYREGRGGLLQDYARAITWFKAAADKGSFRAQRNLGEMYEHGLGVAKDKAQAIALYHKAATQGDKEAKAHLERLDLSVK